MPTFSGSAHAHDSKSALEVGFIANYIYNDELLKNALVLTWIYTLYVEKVSDYDQEIPQSTLVINGTVRKSHKTLTVIRHQEDN